MANAAHLCRAAVDNKASLRGRMEIRNSSGTVLSTEEIISRIESREGFETRLQDHLAREHGSRHERELGKKGTEYAVPFIPLFPLFLYSVPLF